MRNLLFVLILLSSCRVFQPEDFCKKHYPSASTDSTIIKYEVKYDTIREPSYVIVYDTILPLPNTFVLHHESNSGHSHQTVDIKDSKLSIKCNTDSLEKVIQTMSVNINHSSKQIVTVKEFVKHWYDNFLIWYFIISLLIIIVVLIVKLK